MDISICNTVVTEQRIHFTQKITLCLCIYHNNKTIYCCVHKMRNHMCDCLSWTYKKIPNCNFCFKCIFKNIFMIHLIFDTHQLKYLRMMWLYWSISETTTITHSKSIFFIFNNKNFFDSVIILNVVIQIYLRSDIYSAHKVYLNYFTALLFAQYL